MKIRLGFVSNSSSSSFVVAFPRMPKSAEEVKEILFPDREEVEPYGFSLSTQRASEIIFEDIKEPLVSAKEIRREIGGGMIRNDPDAPEPPRFYSDKGYEEYDAKMIKFEDELAVKFFEKNKDSVILAFSYSDNDGGVGCVLEHGDTFGNVPHICSSKH